MKIAYGNHFHSVGDVTMINNFVESFSYYKMPSYVRPRAYAKRLLGCPTELTALRVTEKFRPGNASRDALITAKANFPADRACSPPHQRLAPP